MIDHSSEFLDQRVLVTGASGCIGSHLCRYLCAGKNEIHAISRIKRFENENRIRWWQGDLTEISVVRNIVAAIRPDVVFHLAGYPVGDRGLDHIIPSFRNNLMSTVNLLTSASEVGCRRVVTAGSLEEPEPEKSQVVPSSPYAAAKWAESVYARMFHRLYQLPVVILHISMVYGPAQYDQRKLVPYVIVSLLRGEAPRLTSGKRRIDWIYVGDVVEALITAEKVAHIEGSTIDAGSGNLLSIQGIVELLVRLINPKINPQFGVLPDRPFEQERVANIAQSYALTGWKPTTSLEDGLKKTVDWYEQQLKTGSL